MRPASVYSIFPDVGLRNLGWALVAALLAIAGAGPAAAHMEFHHGRLLDLTRRSDAVWIATVQSAEATETTGGRRIAVEVLQPEGNGGARVLTIPQRLAVSPSSTYAFYVVREATGWRCIHPSGTVLPAVGQGEEYVALDRELRSALGQSERKVAAALLRGLRSPVRELQIHAALALREVAHEGHTLTSDQQQEVRSLLDAAETPAELRPLLQSLVAR